MTTRRDQGTHGAVAVIERDGRFLMIQRSNTVAAPGAWCFPGGAIRPGETPAEALRRELLEELDARVEPLREVWRWRRPEGDLELCWWRADLLNDSLHPNPAEVQDVRWMTAEEIRDTPGVLPNNVTFLNHYLRE
jgi:8-oxo-dGTP pyrophosphatase MutT (NUDIX family)